MKWELILYILLEGLVVGYYLYGTFLPKQKRNFIIMGMLLGYLFLGIIGGLVIPVVNIIGFAIINFLLIFFLFDSNIKNACFQVLMIVAMMMIGEFLVGLWMGIKLDHYNMMTGTNDFILIQAGASKLLFFLLLFVQRGLLQSKGRVKISKAYLGLSVMPLSTLILLFIMNETMNELTALQRSGMVVGSVLLIVTNLVVYWVYNEVTEANEKVHLLQEVVHKNAMDYESLKFLEAQHQNARIMMHDLNKHLMVLEALIQKNNTEAIAYIEEITNAKRQVGIAQFCDNTTLNVVLSQKTKLCKEQGIALEVGIQGVQLGFIKDMDMVAIFSNLLDNAIESCTSSQKKNIRLTVRMCNRAFVSIHLENSADVKPHTHKNRFITRKANAKNHGIGMISIEQAVRQYQGDIGWEYEEEKKEFYMTIVIPI